MTASDVRRTFSNRTIFALWMRRSGVSPRDVCNALGLSTPHYVYLLTGRAARRLGVRLHEQPTFSPLTIIEAHADEIVTSLLANESVPEIAIRIGVSHERLRQWLQKNLNVSTAR